MAMSSAGDERIRATVHTECLLDNSHIILSIACGCPWRFVILTETIRCNAIDKFPSHSTWHW